MINTKKVTGRRDVRYESLDEFLADAESHASDDVQQLGNWSPGQIFEHLTLTLNGSIDGFPFSMPMPVRWMMSTFFKRKFTQVAIPPGFKTSKEFEPPAITAQEGLANLRSAVERQKNESNRVPHPGFGKITNEEWKLFHLRHAEMHMSFLKRPEE